MYNIPKEDDLVTSSEELSALVSMALKNDGANVLLDHRKKIIQHISNLATRIIDTTSIVLSEGPKIVERHVDPVVAVSHVRRGSSSSSSNSSSSSVISRRNRVSRGARSSLSPLPEQTLIMTTLFPSAHNKRKAATNTTQPRSIDVAASQKTRTRNARNKEDGVKRSSNSHDKIVARPTLSVKKASGAHAASASASDAAASSSVSGAQHTTSSLHKWSSEMLYPTGLRVDSLLRIEHHELTDDEVRAALQVAWCGAQSHQHHHSYHEVLHVLSTEIASSPPARVQQRPARGQCFTMSIFLPPNVHAAPVDKEGNKTCVTPMTGVRKENSMSSVHTTPITSSLARRAKGKIMSSATSHGKGGLRQRKHMSPHSHGGGSPPQPSTSTSSSSLRAAATPPSQSMAGVVEETSEWDGMRGAVVRWHPVLPACPPLKVESVKNKTRKTIAGNSPPATCRKGVGTICAGADIVEQLVLEGTGRNYTLRFTAPSSLHGSAFERSQVHESMKSPIKLHVPRTTSPPLCELHVGETARQEASPVSK